MFPQFKHVFAMAMGDEFEPTSIHAYQMADFAETITQEPHFNQEDRKYMNEVKAHIFARTLHLSSLAADIPKIEV